MTFACPSLVGGRSCWEWVASYDVMVNQLQIAHFIPGRSSPMGCPHLTLMDSAMHDMGCLGHTPQIDLPRDWANLALYRDMWV